MVLIGELRGNPDRVSLGIRVVRLRRLAAVV